MSDLRVLGNTVTGANDMALSFRPFTGSEAPHEAISIAGAQRLRGGLERGRRRNKKEGIDVKETAAHGVVHHNHCHDNDRQGLYVDGWFGVLEDVELRDNVVHDNEVGIAVSSEDGPATRDVRIHHNLVFEQPRERPLLLALGQGQPARGDRRLQTTRSTATATGAAPRATRATG